MYTATPRPELVSRLTACSEKPGISHSCVVRCSLGFLGLTSQIAMILGFSLLIRCCNSGIFDVVNWSALVNITFIEGKGDGIRRAVRTLDENIILGMIHVIHKYTCPIVYMNAC